MYIDPSWTRVCFSCRHLPVVSIAGSFSGILLLLLLYFYTPGSKDPRGYYYYYYFKPTSTKPQAEKLCYTYKIMVATAIYSVTMVLLLLLLQFMLNSFAWLA